MRNRLRRRVSFQHSSLLAASHAELREALWDVVVAAQLNAQADDPAVKAACERAIVLLERGEVVR
jgi:hypothetical protein